MLGCVLPFKVRRYASLILAFGVASIIWDLWNGCLEPTTNAHLRCWELPGAADTVVVLRTGATEIASKFPVHVRTTLQCYPNYIIFSDYEETFQGQHVRDALDTVDPRIRQNHPDFGIYRRLQKGGRAGLAPHELGTNISRPDGGSGKGDRPGWKLDKWKFLPMLNHTYHLAPDMKWYVFVETDTYLSWATMLKFQAQLDHTKRYYMGGQMWISDVIFAHGGSGFLVSNAAARALVDYYTAHQSELEDFTAGHWAGDCVLGKTFKDAGVPLTLTWPIIQGDHPGVFPYGRTDHSRVTPLWCYPITTYHHLSADVIEELWDSEQRWIANGGADSVDGFLRNRDVFLHYIMPRMGTPKDQWDNACADEQQGIKDLESCQEACRREPACLQFRFDTASQICTTSIEPQLGEALPQSNYSSGWMYNRIEEWANARPECGPAPWIT